MTDWVTCPVCGEPDMGAEAEEDGVLIACTNLACASNGGTNKSRLAPDPSPAVPGTHNWECRACGDKGYYFWQCKGCGITMPYPTPTDKFPTTQCKKAAPVTHMTAVPENPSKPSAWDDYWASLNKDEQEKLTAWGVDGARAWFGIGEVWGSTHNLQSAEAKIAELTEQNVKLAVRIEELEKGTK